MKHARKNILVIFILLLILVVISCLMYSYRTYLTQKQEEYQKECKETVAKYEGISYPDKSLGEISLSHYDEAELISILKKAIKPYTSCKASIKIDDDALSYTMKDLGQHIYYECSDGKTYDAGDEKELATYLISIDKDLSIEDQYDIIQGDKDATSIQVQIQCQCNTKKLTKVVKKISKKYVYDATDARIDRNYKVSEATEGQSLDTDQIVEDLSTYLDKESTDDYSASYETKSVKPTWYRKDLKKVNTIIARYTTTYNDSTSRGYNIRLAASRLNGICLLPGESISFLDTLYDDTDGLSYQKSAAYYEGKVVQAKGGGICQVSTTAYHTFLLAGIIAKERYPHSMPVGYAELGLDAALSVGNKDLVIENTLDVPLLILAQAKSGTLAVAIQSYKDATKGYTYKPRAKKISNLEAKSYLDVYKGTEKIMTISLSHDTYEKSSN